MPRLRNLVFEVEGRTSGSEVVGYSAWILGSNGGIVGDYVETTTDTKSRESGTTMLFKKLDGWKEDAQDC